MKKIFISAYRNFSLRYILLSRILPTILEMGHEVVVFCKKEDIDYYASLPEMRGVRFRSIQYDLAMSQQRRNRLAHLFMVCRKCIAGTSDNLRNTTSELRLDQYKEGMSQGPLGHILWWIAVLPATHLGRRWRAFRKALVWLESKFFPGEMYDQDFSSEKPDVTVVSSLGNMIDPLFMRSARRHGCKVVSIIYSWDNPSSKEYRGGQPERVVVWNENMREEVATFHDIAPDIIHIGGVAHWDFHFQNVVPRADRAAVLSRYGLNPERRTLFYAVSSYVHFRNTFDDIEMILKEIRTGRFGDAQLLVRLHPAYLLRDGGEDKRIVQRYERRMEELQAEYADLVSFSRPDITFLETGIAFNNNDMYDLADTIYYSDLVLNEFSSIMIESSLLDKPTISLALHNWRDTDKPATALYTYRHIDWAISSGATRTVSTYEALFNAMDEYLIRPELDREGRKRFVDMVFTHNRGKAGEDIGNYIASL